MSTSLKIFGPNILIKHSFTIDCFLKEFVYSFLVSALQRNNGFAPVPLRFATAYMDYISALVMVMMMMMMMVMMMMVMVMVTVTVT